MERLPRVLPFWMMLLGIVGFFILGVLYFDVRGRETRSSTSPTNAGVENVQPLPESADAIDTPTEEELVPLALPPQVPESDIPAVAVYDCWTFELRGDRLVIDRRYKSFGGSSIPKVNEQTLHLFCDDQTLVIRSNDGNRTFFFKDYLETDSALEFLFEIGTLYSVDPYNGKTEKIISVPPPEPEGSSNPSGKLYLSPDNQILEIIWETSSIPQNPFTTLERVSLADGTIRTMSMRNVREPISMNESHTTAIGIERSCAKNNCFEFPVFLHRLNMETGQSVRVGEIFDIDARVTPIFIDDERVVVAGEDTPAFVMNIYTRATAPIKQITSSLDRLAITTDRTHIVVTGPNQPFTVIPVSELPKP